MVILTYNRIYRKFLLIDGLSTRPKNAHQLTIHSTYHSTSCFLPVSLLFLVLLLLWLLHVLLYMEVPIICIANTTTHTHNYTTESIMENEKSNDVLHVVMFPFFAFGHISPFVQLANKLSSHDVKVSFFTASGNATRVKSMLNSAPTTHIVPLTLPQVEGLPPGAESTAELTPVTAELLKVALDLMQPQIRTLLTHLKPHFVLFDFAQEWLPKMVDELGIKTVFYSVFVALSTAFLTCPARVPEPKKYPRLEDMTKPPPGFPHTSVTSVKTFEARDFLYIFKSFHGGPTVYDRVLSGLKGCSAILVKTCSQMEGPYIEYVKAQFNKPVFLVGPVVPD
uniref:Anthocyanidin 3-O-glucosyltransferase-like n=1 Tax=Nicotiana tabacum TaxID=4097 RepID=A0A1S3XP26_TOBAC